MYTNTDMDYILDSHSTLQCVSIRFLKSSENLKFQPYTVSDLRPHDFRNFRGMLRHDFVILFDYATRFPDFNSFTSHEKVGGDIERVVEKTKSYRTCSIG